MSLPHTIVYKHAILEVELVERRGELSFREHSLNMGYFAIMCGVMGG
jgi:hypothetical protein